MAESGEGWCASVLASAAASCCGHDMNLGMCLVNIRTLCHICAPLSSWLSFIQFARFVLCIDLYNVWNLSLVALQTKACIQCEPNSVRGYKGMGVVLMAY